MKNANFCAGAAVVLVVATLAIAPTARAQSASASAAAEALFLEGRALMKKGDYAHACPKFEESQKLDPASGTLVNLAYCYEQAGKTASAWATFADAKVAAKKDHREDRSRFAAQHMRQLEPILSRLSVSVDPKMHRDGLQVTVDGLPLGPGAWGVAVPMDPGKHVIVAKKPGYVTWKKTVQLGSKADLKKVLVPVLEPENEKKQPPAGGPATKTTRSKPLASPKPVAERSTSRSGVASAAHTGQDTATGPGAPGSGSRVLGYVVSGVGLAVLGVGSYFGVQALSRWKDRNAECNAANQCSQAGYDAGEEANEYGYIADVGIGVGVVGVGVGALLLFTGGRSRTPARDEQARTVRVVPGVGKDSWSLTVESNW